MRKKFRVGLYENDPDAPVKISDVERAYMDARKAYEPSYSHPGWGSVAQNKARMLIDILTMTACENGVEVSITTIVRDCVSRWDEYRYLVWECDRNTVLGEPSIGGLIKSYSHAATFSQLVQKEHERHERALARNRELMRSWRNDPS